MPDTVLASTSTTATITVGTAVLGSLETLGDHDWYRITLVAGHKYFFNLDSYYDAGSALDDTYLSLRNSAGTILSSNDDIDPGLVQDSMITYTASVSGTFYLDAGAFENSGTGNFRIAAYDTAAPIATDQIADYLRLGYWGYDDVPDYHFANSVITYSVAGLTAVEQNLARLALQQWDDVAGFSLQELAGLSADITFDHTGSGYAYTLADGVSAAIHISSDWNGSDTSLSGYLFQTYVHELGHALGLGHGGPYNGAASWSTDHAYSNDSLVQSVMSYFWPSDAGTGSDAAVMGPQMADIVAMGAIYGLSTTTRTGDTTYGFHSNAGQIYDLGDAIYEFGAPAFTIFDNGGTDTLDVSGYSDAQRIDLNAETWSDVGGHVNNIAIARGTIIENAIGGTGGDTITGNAAGNSMFGGAGGDTMNGSDGDDYLFGEAGHDTLNGGEGNDTLVGNSDAFAQESDTLHGGNGNDTIVGEMTDSIDGGAGTDVLYAANAFDWSINLGTISIEWMLAGFGNDTINASTQTAAVTVFASGGNDVVTGSGLADFLWGGAGSDTLNGGSGDDVLVGEDGVDSMSGGAGNDQVYTDGADSFVDGGADTDALFVTGGAGIGIDMAAAHFEWLIDYATGSDTISAGTTPTALVVFAGGGTDFVTGGNGDDFLWGESGNDTISGGIGSDILVGGSGIDVLNGGPGSDTIYASSGGSGDGAADVVIFDAAGWGADFVFDFEHGLDQLDLRGSGATLGTVTIFATGGHAYVQFGSDLIVVANAAATFDASDILF